jgi:hypothetical protein
MKERSSNNGKVVRMEEIWKKKGKVGSIVALLSDTKRIVSAIQTRRCALCNTVKMCVNKTGLCSACYLDLSPKEKKVADAEARHKKIKLIVSDDRWERAED